MVAESNAISICRYFIETSLLFFVGLSVFLQGRRFNVKAQNVSFFFFLVGFDGYIIFPLIRVLLPSNTIFHLFTRKSLPWKYVQQNQYIRF